MNQVAGTTAVTKAKTVTNSTTSLSAKTTVLVPPAPTTKVTPRLYYKPHIWNQIQYIIQACPKEVGWWGLVEKIGNDYIVTSLYVPAQLVHGAETDINSEAMANLTMELLKDNKDPGKLYYWGHSHVNMGVSPSGQDETQVREYLENCPVFIRGIYNKSGASKVDIYDVAENVCYESVANGPAHPQLSTEDKALLDKLIAANVKEAPIVVAKTNVTQYRGHQQDDFDDDFGYHNYGRKNTTHQERGKKNVDEIANDTAEVPEDSFFLIGAGSDEYYDSLAVEDAAALHAHIYN